MRSPGPASPQDEDRAAVVASSRGLGPRAHQKQDSATTFEPFRAVGFSLSSLGHAIARRFSAITGEFDLQPREFAILRRISLAEGLSQQALSERLHVPPSRVVAAIDALEARKLLERRPRAQDRRVRELHLTELGQALLQEATLAAADFELALTRELSPAEREQLLRLLDRIAATLQLQPGVHSAETAPTPHAGIQPTA